MLEISPRISTGEPDELNLSQRFERVKGLWIIIDCICESSLHSCMGQTDEHVTSHQHNRKGRRLWHLRANKRVREKTYITIIRSKGTDVLSMHVTRMYIYCLFNITISHGKKVRAQQTTITGHSCQWSKAYTRSDSGGEMWKGAREKKRDGTLFCDSWTWYYVVYWSYAGARADCYSQVPNATRSRLLQQRAARSRCKQAADILLLLLFLSYAHRKSANTGFFNKNEAFLY